MDAIGLCADLLTTRASGIESSARDRSGRIFAVFPCWVEAATPGLFGRRAYQSSFAIEASGRAPSLRCLLGRGRSVGHQV